MGFVAYEVSLELNSALRPLVERLKTRNRDLADQLKRAASSVALNIAEGGRREHKDRIHHYRIAAGSAAEVGAAVDVARCWGEIDEPSAETVRSLIDRQLRLLRGLTRSK